MRPVLRTIQNLLEDADGVFLAQSVAGALPVVLNGAFVVDGNAVLAPAQKISVASSGDDSGISINLVGKDPDGQAITEVLPLTNIGTATSVNYFSQIQPTTSTTGATAGTITGGTLRADGAMSKTIVMNYKERGQFNIGLQMILTPTIDVTLRYTLENAFTPRTNGFANNAIWNEIIGLTAITASADSNLIISIFALQILVNSADAAGIAKLVALQGG